jgi:LemA protein
MIFGHKVKPNFAVADEAAVSAPPKVDFTKPAPAPAQTPAPAPVPAVPAPAQPAPAKTSDAGTGDAVAAAGDLLKKGY